MTLTDFIAVFGILTALGSVIWQVRVSLADAREQREKEIKETAREKWKNDVETRVSKVEDQVNASLHDLWEKFHEQDLGLKDMVSRTEFVASTDKLFAAIENMRTGFEAKIDNLTRSVMDNINTRGRGQ